MPAPTVDSLQRSAKVYAETDWAGTYTRLCIPAGGPFVLPTVNPALYPSADLPLDNSYFKAHTAQARRDGKKRLWANVPNPYYIGQRAVVNYTAVVELCAMAAKLRATGSL